VIEEGTRSAPGSLATLPRFSELLAEAELAAARSHAPYSGYRVGAAVLDDKGVIYLGCNLESAAYGATLCAERGAIAAAVADGALSLIACITVARDADPASCCGICRQLLMEYGANPLIVNASLSSDRLRWGPVSDWLPFGFSGASLDATLRR
jgi:cytidine deaminase